MPRYKPIVQRFHEKYIVNSKTNCWEWQGGMKGIGYGTLKGERGQGSYIAHRFSYEFYKGKIPDGMIVCHRCDNTACVNPDHLFAADHAANMRDMQNKGRARVLSADEVRDIKNLVETGAASQSAVAREYGVSRSTVDRALVLARNGDFGGHETAKGSKYYTILSDDARETVRKLARDGDLSIMEIGKRFNVDRKTVRNLRDGKDVGRYSKLKKEQIEEIIGHWESGLRQQAIADMYDIHQTHVSRIVRGTSWVGLKSKAHLPKPEWAARKGQLKLL